MPKRILQGKVVSDRGDKSIVVVVERRIMHPLFKKFVRKSKRFHAHDEANQAKIGDVVRICECRPVSKLKTWRLIAAEETPAAASVAGAGADSGAGVGSGHEAASA